MGIVKLLYIWKLYKNKHAKFEKKMRMFPRKCFCLVKNISITSMERKRVQRPIWIMHLNNKIK